MLSPEIKIKIDTSELKELVDSLEIILNTLIEVKNDLKDQQLRMHELGNAISGKLGAKEAELFIRQVVKEEIGGS